MRQLTIAVLAVEDDCFAGSDISLFTSFESHFGVAELMGGAAGVVSRPGEGSTYWFTARLGKGSSDRVKTATTPHESALVALPREHAGRRVLLVEDEVINREATLGMREDSGQDIDAAEDVMDDFISKPVDPDALFATLLKWLTRPS